MRIIVGLKQDLTPRRAYVHKRKGILLFEDPTYSLNPFDRRALEAALQLKEAVGGEVITLTVGGGGDPELVAREALAMGADRAILVEGVDPSAIGIKGAASIFRAVLEKLGGYDLLVFGERSTDYAGGAFGQYISGLLGLPLAYRVVKIEAGDGDLLVEEKIPEGVRVVRLKIPAVIVVDGTAFKPRYPSTWGISDAFKRMDIERYSLAELGVKVEKPGLRGVRYFEPEALKPRVERLPANEVVRRVMKLIGGG